MNKLIHRITSFLIIPSFVTSGLFGYQNKLNSYSETNDYISIYGEQLQGNCVYLAENIKTLLSADADDAETYQWQIKAPESAEWFDIYNQYYSECTLSQPLLLSCLDGENAAFIRCQAYSEGVCFTSDEVKVIVTPDNDEILPLTEGLLNVFSPLMNLTVPQILADDPDDEPELITHTIKIKYLYYNEGPDTTGSVANEYIATIADGTTFKASPTSPVRTGYNAYCADISGWDGTRWYDGVDESTLTDGMSYFIAEHTVTSDETYYVVYLPSETTFHVNRYKQNIYDDFYTFDSTEEKTALVGTEVTGMDDLKKAYTGFSMLQYEDATVAADGSTLVEIFYDREYHLMNFQLDGGYGVKPVYARYGTELRVGKPTKAGYQFVKWELGNTDNLTSEQISAANGIIAKLNNNEAVTIPEFDMVIDPVWQANETNLTVVFWHQNADLKEGETEYGYSYADSLKLNVPTGSTVSSETYANSDPSSDSAGFTYNSAKAESVTVSGDGSTVLNVYGDRRNVTITFYDGKKVVASYTRKYGADISDIWVNDVIAPQYDKGGCFAKESNGKEQCYFMENMPAENIDLYAYYKNNGGTKEGQLYYYVEYNDMCPKPNAEIPETTYGGKKYYLQNQITFLNNGSYDITVPNGYYPLKGFKRTLGDRNIKLGGSEREYSLYYDRLDYSIFFEDGYGKKVAEIGNIFYQTKINTITYNGKPLSDIEPAYPDVLEPGAYVFDGWYTTPDCVDGTEADFNSKMPDSSITFYAKWKKVNRNVKFYASYNDMMNGTLIPDTPDDDNDVMVEHGSPVQYASTLSRPGYNFVGWFYNDAVTGEKIAFLPNNMPVTEDMKIYAEWTADRLIRYTIHYMGAEALTNPDGTYIMANGKYVIDMDNLIQLSDDTTGQFHDGRTKTFSAKALPELYEGYNYGYFPMLSNHAIMFSADTSDIDKSVTVNQVGDTYEIEYTFYYVHLNGVEYTMEFINSLTGTNVFKDSDGNTFTVDPITNETPAAVVTERFKNIAGYIPDEYQKRLILTATPENNVITFYYTESADPTYLIEHYTENPDGTWTIQASEFSSKPSGSSVSDVTRSFVGHTFNPDQTWVNAQNVELVQDTTYDIWAKNYTQGANNTYTAGGTLETGKTLVIRFYYPLTEYEYIVEHRIYPQNADPSNPIVASECEYLFGENDEDSSRTYTAKYGQRVTANAKGVRDRALALGYWVDGSRDDPTRLVQSKMITESNNVITFWYVDEPIEINYRVWVDGKTGTSVKGCFVTPTLDSTNSHTDNSNSPGKISGSIPYAGRGYVFAGWFKDEDCSIPVDSSWVDDDNRLIPQKEGENNIVKQTTYYAKFMTYSLIIQKTGDDVDENDTFLFRVTNKGTSGEDSIDITVSIKGKGSAFITQIPMGEYEVEEISDWSWKYGTVEPQTASIPDKCTVTFTNTKNTSKKWLGGESSVNNKFSAAENNG